MLSPFIICLLVLSSRTEAHPAGTSTEDTADKSGGGLTELHQFIDANFYDFDKYVYEFPTDFNGQAFDWSYIGV